MLGKEGLLQPVNHLWGPGGAQWLDETDMAVPYDTRVRSLRRLIKPYDAEITKLDTYIAQCSEGPRCAMKQSKPSTVSARCWRHLCRRVG